jgi:hypothetical protein
MARARKPDPETAPTVPASALPAEPHCPRCGGKLTNPDGLGWCADCGYCRSLAEEEQVIPPPPEPAAPRKPSALGATEVGEAMRRMPRWAWPLLGGVVLVAGASSAADYLLPEDGLARALCSATQLVLSVVGLVAAQMWAVLLIGDQEDGLGARDLFLPGRVWRAAFRRLPATRKPVWLGAWSLTALVCGVAVIGGFGYWLDLAQEQRVRRVAEKLAEGEARKDTGRDWNGVLAPPPKPPPPLLTDEKGPATECVVIGYQTDGTTVTGIVLAMVDAQRDQLRFAGVVRSGLTPEMRQELMSRLSRLGRKGPLIPGLSVKGTIWVNPGVFCDIIRPDGKAPEGEEPTIQGLKD